MPTKNRYPLTLARESVLRAMVYLERTTKDYWFTGKQITDAILPATGLTFASYRGVNSTLYNGLRPYDYVRAKSAYSNDGKIKRLVYRLTVKGEKYAGSAKLTDSVIITETEPEKPEGMVHTTPTVKSMLLSLSTHVMEMHKTIQQLIILLGD